MEKFVRFPSQVENFERKHYLRRRENLEKKFYLTCPVRNATEEEKEKLAAYVSGWECKEVGIYYPKWDTEQGNDPIGLRICLANLGGITYASEGVIKYLSRDSEGSVFDDGMAIMKNKPMRIINSELEKVSKKDLKEMPQIVQSIVLGYYFNEVDDYYKKLLERREEIKNSEIIEYDYRGRTSEFLFDFGMVLAAKKKIKVINEKEVKWTKNKSFENVLLTLNGVEDVEGLFDKFSPL
jgi:hypothetical protein